MSITAVTTYFRTGFSTFSVALINDQFSISGYFLLRQAVRFLVPEASLLLATPVMAAEQIISSRWHFQSHLAIGHAATTRWFPHDQD
jgi:hypothetical protein